MTSPGTAATRRSPALREGSQRLTGIDAARGLALLGMMATHLMATFGRDLLLTPTWVGLAFSGRAAALFAVLAGVGLALSTGREQPRTGPELSAARRGIAARALVIALVGLLLGGLEVNIAVILVHYAVLFLCVLPFIGIGVRALCAWAAGWVLLSPLLAYLVRPWLLETGTPLRLGHNPNLEDFQTPGKLVADLFFTGYYPVFQWLSYLLIGLVIGRLALTASAVQLILLAGGMVVAAGAKILGTLALDEWGGREALHAIQEDPSFPLDSLLQVNLTGVEQSGSGWWLATSAPHSGTTLDLLHTSGVAAAVIGLCLLIARLGEWLNLNLLLPFSGPGAMTLSLYSAHVWLVAAMYGQPLPIGWTEEGMYLAQALPAVGIGILFAVLGWRGPLEQLAHSASQLARYRRVGVG
ncbi:heparan-alpha-glucosaminide N-acetyltransferase domain-containing protein [Arthrobacter sp. ISL-30]|uniref:heparan-alpha-glucosaminide N-acetyltransferase domain-containing protein n=1 Tax=Arthrobacter sp. ISL-30 TaxID=2819109 RepID=UPI001BEC056B|nr:heparan-alpha-glucosaminide N-acetyltransferase domain-containing protein [Arthrobacter sp. ISL-30]MBT2514254.1 DUF1624 domain-containing protein [Arthrobacter sp. ISL-30]